MSHVFFLDIHAGVVSNGRQCFVFPVVPGSGKPTLVTALVANDFGFLVTRPRLFMRLVLPCRQPHCRSLLNMQGLM